MSDYRLSEVPKVTVPRSVVEATLNTLQDFGRSHLEGLVLWLGDVSANGARVIHAVVPDQQGISGENGVGYFVTGETLFLLNRTLAETGLRLIAQIHSHPGAAYHSATDDRYAIVTTEGGLSLVVPNFGKASADPADWAVYRLEHGEWVRIDRTKGRLFLQIIEE